MVVTKFPPRLVIQGLSESLMIPLIGKSCWIIGRDDSCDIVLTDPRISRKHAKLVLESEVIFSLTDLASVNGTFVNKQRLTAPMLLRHGDLILLGKTHLEFCCAEDNSNESPDRTFHDEEGQLDRTFSGAEDSSAQSLLNGNNNPAPPFSGEMDTAENTSLMFSTIIQSSQSLSRQQPTQAEPEVYEPEVQGAKKFALLVGMSGEGTGLKSLPEAISNVKIMRQILEHPEIGHFAKTQTLLNPDPPTLESAIEAFAVNCQSDDLLLLYFCGYGAYDSADGLYLATRPDLATRLATCSEGGSPPRSQALAASKIQAILNRSPAENQIVILDLHLSGELLRESPPVTKLFDEQVTPGGSEQPELFEVINPLSLETQLGGARRVVINGAGWNQAGSAAEGTELFPYTHYFVEGMTTGAADLNDDGFITLEEAHEYTSRKVRTMTPAAEPALYGAPAVKQQPLAKVNADDPKLVYRKAVEQCAQAGVISLLDRSYLNVQREQLAITSEVAQTIEAAVLKPHLEYRQKLQQYTHALANALIEQSPLSQEKRTQLSRLQRSLGLPLAEVARLETELTPQPQCHSVVDDREGLDEIPPPLSSDQNHQDNRKRLFYWLFGGAIGALVLSLGLISFFVLRQITALPKSQLTLPEALNNPNNHPSSNNDLTLTSVATKFAQTLNQVPNVPEGTFDYGGSTSFAPLRSVKILQPISQAFPSFKLRYLEPIGKKPGSGTGIAMLIEGEISIAQSSRPLKDQEIAAAAKRGFKLDQVAVAIDGLAFYVNRQLNIPGLTLAQIRDIYTGKITNWQTVGGPNLPIIPFSRDRKAGGTVDFFAEHVLENQSLASRVKIVRDTTQSVQKVASTPGGIGYASAPEVIGQKTIHPLPIGKLASQGFVSPVADGNPNTVNEAAIANGSYPVTRRLFIIIKRDGRLDEQAGVAYTNMLLSNEGQDLVKQAGFAPVR